MFDQDALPASSALMDRAIQHRTLVPTVEPGSPEEAEALAHLDAARHDHDKELTPGARARARRRHRRHWARANPR